MAKLTANNVKFTRSVGTRTIVPPLPPYTSTLTKTFENPQTHYSNWSRYFGSSIDTDGTHHIVGSDRSILKDSSLYYSGMVYVFDNNWNIVHKLYSPNAQSNGYFGNSVAIDGNYFAVGADNEDTQKSGRVYVYDTVTGNLLHTLSNPNVYSTVNNDYFGDQIALSGNKLVVATRFEDSTVTSSSGVIYVYDVTTGNLLHTIENPESYSNNLGGDQFGYSVAIDGDNIVVGTPNEQVGSLSSAGVVYVISATTGNVVRTITSPNASVNDDFGMSVDIDGDYVIIGDGSEDQLTGTNGGGAWIFRVSDGALIQTLSNPNVYSATTDDRFGSYVAIKGTRVVVGAQGEDATTNTNEGAAYVFDRDTGTLIHTFTNPNLNTNSSIGDLFGSAVAITDTEVIIGAYGEERFNAPEEVGTYAGAVYVFDLTTGTRTHDVQPAVDYGITNNDKFGSSIISNNNYVYITAPEAFNAGGTVNIYDKATNELLRTISGRTILGGDSYLGKSIDCTDNYLVIGAYRYQKVFVYNASGDTLLHTLDNPSVYSTATNDDFGTSVACNDSYVLVGAIHEDQATNTSSGAVYQFNITTGSLVRAYESDQPSYPFYGYGVTVTSDKVFISHYTFNSSAGRVVAFDLATGTELYTLSQTPSGLTNALFGYSVATYEPNNIIAVGAYGRASNTGAVYLFNLSDGSFIKSITRPVSVPTAAQFSRGLALNDKYIAISVPGIDTPELNTGAITIVDYVLDEEKYFITNPNNYDTGVNDQFGIQLYPESRPISFDGNDLFVGTYSEDDAQGQNAGIAHKFNLNT